MAGVFLDTGFFVALAFIDDEFHERAVELFPRIIRGELGKPVYTSDAVLFETVAMVHCKCGGLDKDRRACQTASTLLELVDSYGIEINYVDKEWYDNAKQLYVDRNGELDFVDALDVVFSRTNNVQYIAAFDTDFDPFANEGIYRLC